MCMCEVDDSHSISSNTPLGSRCCCSAITFCAVHLGARVACVKWGSLDLLIGRSGALGERGETNARRQQTGKDCGGSYHWYVIDHPSRPNKPMATTMR
jgi:hypothetical protein